jgi:hypothetical protein
MSDNDERVHCLRRAEAIAGPFSPLATPIADAIESERQSAREPLEARVRELETRLLLLAEAAKQAESYLTAHCTFNGSKSVAIRDNLRFALEKPSE